MLSRSDPDMQKAFEVTRGSEDAGSTPSERSTEPGCESHDLSAFELLQCHEMYTPSEETDDEDDTTLLRLYYVCCVLCCCMINL